MIKKEAVNKGIDYIMEHLNEEISVDDVAEYCHFSKYYFCRMFREETGESVYAFIKRMRVNRSAVRLQLEKDTRVTDIGLDYGYSSTNYSAVFKKQHDLSPAEYRKAKKDQYVPSPFYPDDRSGYASFAEYEEQISVRELGDLLVIYERFIGNYAELANAWQGFIAGYRQYRTAGSRYLERAYDDPSVTDLSRCVYDMCMTVDQSCPLENRTVIPGGRYAICPYKGRVEGIYPVFQGMFHRWLPDSGYVMADNYGLNQYRVLDFEGRYVEMDLCIPVKRARIHK